jgi:hypothetical protein
VVKGRRIRGAGHVARMGRGECIQGFGGKPERKRPLGRFSNRWGILLTFILIWFRIWTVIKPWWNVAISNIIT